MRAHVRRPSEPVIISTLIKSNLYVEHDPRKKTLLPLMTVSFLSVNNIKN
jgi:hypothetical protein